MSIRGCMVHYCGQLRKKMELGKVTSYFPGSIEVCRGDIFIVPQSFNWMCHIESFLCLVLEQLYISLEHKQLLVSGQKRVAKKNTFQIVERKLKLVVILLQLLNERVLSSLNMH